MATDEYCGLLKLPTELLLLIFNLLLERKPWTWDSNVYPLLLVCRRLNELAASLAYENVSIRVSDYTLVKHDFRLKNDTRRPRIPRNSFFEEPYSVTRSRLLIRTLRRSPHLRPYCRRLCIYSGRKTMSHRSKPTFITGSAIRTLIGRLSGITELHVIQHAVPDGAEFDLFDIITHVASKARDLQQLKIESDRGQWLDLVCLPDALHRLAAPRLEILDLKGVSSSNFANRTPRSWNDILLPRSAPFTELKLDGLAVHQDQTSESVPMLLKALTKWPKLLRKVSISLGYFSPLAQMRETGPTPADIRSCLSWQQDSLTHVDIGPVEFPTLDGFCLDTFTNLVSLRLSTSFTGREAKSLSNIFAPNLREFRWNFGDDPSLWCFQEREESWIRALATLASEQGSKLELIGVDYTPEWLGYPSRSDSSLCPKFLYPWDRLERVGTELRASGIRLVYDGPTVSRKQVEDWKQEDREDQRDSFALRGYSYDSVYGPPDCSPPGPLSGSPDSDL